MKILYLAHRIPFPPNKGDKIRSFHQIKYLSENHQLDLVCLADNSADLKYQSDLEKICHRVAIFTLTPLLGKLRGILSLSKGNTISVHYFYQKNMQKVVDQWLDETEYDAIICFSSVMAEYLFCSSNRQVQAKLASAGQGAEKIPPQLLMDFCDVDSDKWAQYSLDAKLPLNIVYHLEQLRLLKYEKKVNQQFDHSIFVTDNEKTLFTRLYPEAKRLAVIRNGVDFDFFSPGADFLKIEKKGVTLVFTGAMDYHANVDGVQWFCYDIWPKIRQQLPDCQFYIVGSNPTPAVTALAALPGVTVTGFVDDIRSYYAMADLSVIPLRLARGVQNKALEAMAMGKPVVTTAKVASGVGATPDQHLLVADEVNDYVTAIMQLLADKTYCQQIAESGQNFVRDSFSWNSNMAEFEQLLGED